jgi:hypothetical protein
MLTAGDGKDTATPQQAIPLPRDGLSDVGSGGAFGDTATRSGLVHSAYSPYYDGEPLANPAFILLHVWGIGKPLFRISLMLLT